MKLNKICLLLSLTAIYCSDSVFYWCNKNETVDMQYKITEHDMSCRVHLCNHYVLVIVSRYVDILYLSMTVTS